MFDSLCVLIICICVKVFISGSVYALSRFNGEASFGYNLKFALIIEFVLSPWYLVWYIVFLLVFFKFMKKRQRLSAFKAILAAALFTTIVFAAFLMEDFRGLFNFDDDFFNQFVMLQTSNGYRFFLSVLIAVLFSYLFYKSVYEKHLKNT